MPAEPAVVAVHATAVAIGGRALLIRGPSRSGKSRLALALIDASTRRRPIRLVGDDRILLAREGGETIARPHPRIAGFIERRGLGIVAIGHLAAAPLAAVVDLGGAATSPNAELQNFPVLSIVTEDEAGERSDRVLRWWADVQTANVPDLHRRSATCAQHSAAKAAPHAETSGKD